MKLKRLSYILFLIGLAVFLYPEVSKLMVDIENKSQFAQYEYSFSTRTEEEIQDDIKIFEKYNESVASETESYVDPFIAGVLQKQYQAPSILKNGAFGYLEIPRIQEVFPIFLGASKENLAKGVAQLENTSLPVGGTGTNCVIAGHRGYYAASVFRYLDQMKKGDHVYVYAYGKTLTYEVTGTEIIAQNQTEKLLIDPDLDQLTLLTCTPYRVSTHRLLIYTKRVPNDGKVMENYSHETIPVNIETVNTPAEVLQEETPVETSMEEIIKESLPEIAKEDKKATVISGYSDEISSVARESKILSYVIVGGGSILWFGVFSLFLTSFRKKGNRG